MLLTCHTPGFDPAALRAMMLDVLGGEAIVIGENLTIRSVAGHELPSGMVVRWKRGRMNNE